MPCPRPFMPVNKSKTSHLTRLSVPAAGWLSVAEDTESPAVLRGATAGEDEDGEGDEVERAEVEGPLCLDPPASTGRSTFGTGGEHGKIGRAIKGDLSCAATAEGGRTEARGVCTKAGRDSAEEDFGTEAGREERGMARGSGAPPLAEGGGLTPCQRAATRLASLAAKAAEALSNRSAKAG